MAEIVLVCVCNDVWVYVFITEDVYVDLGDQDHEDVDVRLTEILRVTEPEPVDVRDTLMVPDIVGEAVEVRVVEVLDMEVPETVLVLDQEAEFVPVVVEVIDLERREECVGVKVIMGVLL